MLSIPSATHERNGGHNLDGPADRPCLEAGAIRAQARTGGVVTPKDLPHANEPLNWDEFRIVKAIAEAQSLSGAAERLGLNHSTLFRRLAAVESRLGVRLFERERTGYRPTMAGGDMVALASLMGATIDEFERRVSHNSVKLSGRVRVTTLSSIGLFALPEACAAFSATHPDVQIEVNVTETSLDLFRNESDIALRWLREPPAAELIARHITPLPWAVFATEALASLGPQSPWIVPCESFGPTQVRTWLDRNIEPWRRRATVDNDVAMAEFAARGVGVALLPCFVAMTKPELRRIGEIDVEIDGDLWALTTERALRMPRVRAAYEFLCDILTSRRAWFAGQSPAGS